MIKTILASLTGFGSDRAVLDAAFAVAGAQESHVTCLHTRIDPSDGAAILGVSALQIHGNLLDLAQRISQEQQERSGHAKSAFADASRSHNIPVGIDPDQAKGPSASLQEVTTFLDETLHVSRYHDLVVTGRAAELNAAQLHALVMDSGRPVLLAPSRPTSKIGEKVMIAWKDGPEAARALTAAMPFLIHAKQVTIAMVSDHGASDVADLTSAQSVARQLKWHGIQADVQLANSPALSTSKKLEEIAFALDADLIIMGAYGHSRMREFIFGGVTKDLLGACALPLLVAH